MCILDLLKDLANCREYDLCYKIVNTSEKT